MFPCRHWLPSPAAGLGLVFACVTGCAGEASVAVNAARGSETPAPLRLRVRVLAEHPHDARSYTQGLLWHDGWVYESRGRYGQSGVRRYRLDEEAAANVDLDDAYFGEGLALVGDRLFQLTWQDGVVLVYGAEDLEPIEERPFRGEGWGLTYDGESLIASDGSHVLTFLDPNTLEVRRRLLVRQQGALRDALNELEYAEGVIWANVYQTDEIVRIDPQTGTVTAVVDAAGLLDSTAVGAEVLNGIAWRDDTGTFLLTGKYWPRMFEVVFEGAGERAAPVPPSPGEESPPLVPPAPSAGRPAPNAGRPAVVDTTDDRDT